MTTWSRDRLHLVVTRRQQRRQALHDLAEELALEYSGAVTHAHVRSLVNRVDRSVEALEAGETSVETVETVVRRLLTDLLVSTQRGHVAEAAEVPTMPTVPQQRGAHSVST